ncbi:MAG: 2-hydroxychromene-2-carboxylate isomerase [Rhodospirillales bacterium]|nr:2-hydroxychromene-2-carboxylate isomerase [Rhodospirillales bacterium]
MTKTIDYYFALISPFAYVGDAELTKMAERHGATIRRRPVELGKIFPETGGIPLPKRSPARQAYRLVELDRVSKFRGVEINLQPKFFPAAEWPAAGMVVAAEKQGLDSGALVNGILKACWTEERDIADVDTLKAIAEERGLDGQALLDAAKDEVIKAAYSANTEEALAAGVFGSPSYVYNDEVFWGQDRLEYLDRALGDK